MLFPIMPVIVTTYEAFCSTVKMDLRVIFVDDEVYRAHTSEVRKALYKHGYSVLGYPTDFGIAFAKRGVDIEQLLW